MASLYSPRHLQAVWEHFRWQAPVRGERWQNLRHRLRTHGVPENPGWMLEIGCGRAYPYTALFSTVGERIVGTDIDLLWPNRLHPPKYARWLPHLGVMRTLRRAAGDFILSRAYYPELCAQSGVPVINHDVLLTTANAGALAFGMGVFDAAVSSSAFEHILDVPTAVAELARVLKPGGIADIEVHLFPSITGGHDTGVSHRRNGMPDARRWRHLLAPDWHPPPVTLNRWKEAQYRAAFEKHFDVLERVVTSAYGAQYVTEELLERLPQYSRDDVSSEFVAFVLRRRS